MHHCAIKLNEASMFYVNAKIWLQVNKGNTKNKNVGNECYVSAAVVV